MQYITDLNSHQWKKRTAVTLGKFDGLHRGHQKLVEKIREYGNDGCESVVCAFDMGRETLMTKEERRRHLEGKADYLIDCPFTRELREMEAEDFIGDILSRRLCAAHLVVGTDFSFGHNKRGNAAMLEEYAGKYGYTVDVVEKERYQGRVISSTYIKEALSGGDVELAGTLLGYPYEMSGTVEHGKRLGRTLGFPTMNIEPEEKKILPRFGVYACRVEIDGIWYGGIGNAGIKPTVTSEHKRLLEVFVFGYEGDAYGKRIRAQFCDFERPETKFASVEELKEHVMKDIRYGEEYFRRHPVSLER
ncbi:riboflavin biosynthesis protein RibF [Lachnoclostridium sp. An169]|uniref:bifunctional riboflavin kinase/FAD synthetase n=1 Tax=Lachnoclostridium sp. An169 TaxID=1965569 RepID=UPI000B39165C|nr:bifunctional riboflavin kinase/FAD synthetase [Lachnoclostridium sp. An169]OUP84823.1 riboflavin biosynthesis protein RibF [Lachnoclostridium sp. An169]